MIFVVVGTQMPFDRLIHAVDEWAREVGRDDVFAQIGKGTPPSYIGHERTLTVERFNECMQQSSLIIAHAGMGTILNALQWDKEIIVMPRRHSLGEHQNDHQFATARKLVDFAAIPVAMDENELQQMLRRPDNPHATRSGLLPFMRNLLGEEPGRSESSISPYASDELIEALSDFINR